jgi:hypothetical protein
MKHIKKLTESTDNKPSLEEMANFLIKSFQRDYKMLPHTVGTPHFEYKDDVRDAKPGVVVSQYSDFFFILGQSMESMDLPIAEILLGKPYRGKLYASKQDGLLQIRISGFTVKSMMKG